MADQIAVCNLALDACGARSTLASLTEGSEEANALSLHFAPAAEAVLQAARWNFARAQATLTLLRDATQNQVVPVPWLYEYLMPSDCVQGRFIMPQVFSNSPGALPGVPSVVTAVAPAVRWVKGTDKDDSGNDTTVILTNQMQAILVYTRRILNPQLWDGQFLEAFRVYLAHRVCMRLTGNKQLATALFQEAGSLCDAAAASSANEGLTVLDQVPDWIKVRGYCSDWAAPDGNGFQYGGQALSQIL